MKGLIIYGSTTGNTEFLAEVLSQEFEKEGLEIDRKDASLLKEIQNIAQPYDFILLGCSSWGVDEIVFQEDFIQIYQHMNILGIENKKVGVFACGDVSYTYFCGAADEIQRKASNLKGRAFPLILKVDGFPDESLPQIKEWAQAFIKFIKN